MSRGPIHVLNFFRPGSLHFRVSLHSASAWAPFRPIEMSRQRRVRGAVDALAWNAAHSHRIWRHQEVALLRLLTRDPVRALLEDGQEPVTAKGHQHQVVHLVAGIHEPQHGLFELLDLKRVD